jgi:arylsulfatase A-like enzyme
MMSFERITQPRLRASRARWNGTAGRVLRTTLALLAILSFACSEQPASHAAPEATAQAAAEPASAAAPEAKAEPAPITWDLSGWTAAPLPDEVPNVVLLVVDTLARHRVSGYGYARQTTPNLDRLVREGVRFDAAIAPSSWSPPSHSSIVSGLLPFNHRAIRWQDRLAETAPPLAVYLKDLGYRTGLFSSHKSLAGGVHGITAGIDHEFVEGRGDQLILETAAAWIEEADEPFFAHVIVTSPHAPYQEYPDEYDDLYFLDMPSDGKKTYPFIKKRHTGEGGIPKVVRMGDHDTVGFYVNRYDRGLLYVDSLIGEFLNRLQAQGKLSNTLLVVTSDHGESLGEHDYFGHEVQLYDTLVRVPLAFWYPERLAGGAVWEEQVQLVDLTPTILGFLGQTAPEHLDGIDLSAHLLQGTRPEEGRVALGSYLFRKQRRFMARSDTHKLIYTEGGREEFYDLVADPDEADDLLIAGAEGLEAADAVTAYTSLRGSMNALLEAHASLKRGPPAVPLSDELIEELRALGYLGDDATSFER